MSIHDGEQICTMYDWIEFFKGRYHCSTDDAALRIQENLEMALQDYKDDHDEL